MTGSLRRWVRAPLDSVSTRIALPAGFFALVSVGLLSFILIREQREQVLGEVVHGSEKIAEAILLSLDHDMRVNRRDGVEQLIGSLGQHKDIESIRIFNKDGSIAFSSRPGEVGRNVDKDAEACVQCHIAGKRPMAELNSDNRSRMFTDTSGKRLLATIHVIRNREGCEGSECHAPVSEQSVLGVLDVAMSVETAHARLAAATRNAVLIALAAAALITSILVIIIRQGASKQRLEEWAASLEQEVAAEAAELREAQFQIIQAEKLSSVGLVAAGIAHELNSPLMAIVTFAHLVKSSLPEESQAQEDLRMIEREANRCASIIRQLLDYSRKQSQEPEMHPCGIRAVITGALELLKVERQNMGITVKLDVAEDLPEVDANDLQLMQVFVNLMLNAMQAMPDGGELTISADVVERRLYERLDLPPHGGPSLLRIIVRDTGIGIARQDLMRVFDPFFTTKPVGKGSGLGLSVSLGLVQRFRGTIAVDSDGASWTAFTVFLPVSTQPSLVTV